MDCSWLLQVGLKWPMRNAIWSLIPLSYWAGNNTSWDGVGEFHQKIRYPLTALKESKIVPGTLSLWLDWFELCNLLRIVRLAKSAESFEHLEDRKSVFITVFSWLLPNLAWVCRGPFLTVWDRPRDNGVPPCQYLCSIDRGLESIKRPKTFLIGGVR